MFNVGGGEILVILLVALLVLGPDKLPEAARSAGKLYRQLRELSSGFQQEFREAIDDAPTQGRRTVHPDAGAGPSLPPLTAATPAEAATPARTEATTTPSPGDADRPPADAAAPPTDRPTAEDAGPAVQVEGPGASFS